MQLGTDEKKPRSLVQVRFITASSGLPNPVTVLRAVTGAVYLMKRLGEITLS
jgi:hypothetical protein